MKDQWTKKKGRREVEQFCHKIDNEWICVIAICVVGGEQIGAIALVMFLLEGLIRRKLINIELYFGLLLSSFF